MNHIFRLSILLAVTAFVVLPVTAVSDEEPGTSETQTTADVASEPAAYVGDETCTTCHENAHPNFADTIHARVLGPSGTRGGEWAQTCESCHGAGAAHVEAGGGEAGDLVTFQAESMAEIERENAACLDCHRMGQQLHWDGSTHDSRGLACTSCHNPVEKVSQRAGLSHPNGVAVCTSCHLEQKSKIYRNNHMPMRPAEASPTDGGREPWMDCSSCHNPHGSPTEHMLVRNSTPETCYTCHADKRGPFLWEHAPVNEDCGNCHDPHGSTRQAMLKLSQPRLCQSCHLSSLHPGEARQPGSKFVIGNSCLNCHSKIHGSNHPSGFVFTR